MTTSLVGVGENAGNAPIKPFCSTTLLKVLRVGGLLLVGAGLGLGAFAYFRLQNFPLLYGAGGLAFSGILSLAFGNLLRPRLSRQQAEQILKATETQFQKHFLKALQKLENCRFKEIWVVGSWDGTSDLYFGSQDGQAKECDVTNTKKYPPGSLLVVRVALDKKASERIMQKTWLEALASVQPELAEYLKIHKHAFMSLDEYAWMQVNEKFPWALRNLIEG